METTSNTIRSAKSAVKSIYNRYGMRKEGTHLFMGNILAIYRKAKDNDIREGVEIAEYYKGMGTPLIDVLIFSGRKIYSFAEQTQFTLASALRA